MHFSFGSDHYNNDESLHHVLQRQLLHHEQSWNINTPFQVDSLEQSQNTLRLYELLLQSDFDGLKQLFHSFFASIPHHWYTNNQIQDYESYYASVFYSYFAALGLKVVVEDCTNLGRIDMTLLFNQQVYLFEFKVVELAPEGKALGQMKAKAYADKYRPLGQPIYLIGVEFSKESRNVVERE